MKLYLISGRWEITVTKKCEKQINSLSESVRRKLRTLIQEMEINGPVRGNWPNYSKLGGKIHHCHIKNGRPSYVACWIEKEGEIKVLEVYYVDTREKAPY